MNKIKIAFVIIGVLLLVGALIITLNNVVQQSGFAGIQPKLVVPSFSSAKCEVNLNEKKETKIADIPSSGYSVVCPGDNCVVNVATIEQPGFFGGIRGIFWNKCLVGTNCIGKNLHKVDLMKTGPQLTVSFRYNEQVFIQYGEVEGFTTLKFKKGTTGGINYITYNPLQLDVFDGLFSGRRTIIKDTCDLSKAPAYNLNKRIINAPGYAEANDLCSDIECLPGGIANWVAKETVQTFAKNPVVEYKGEQKLCQQPGVLWNLLEIKLVEGGSALYPVSVGDKVNCCPGTEQAGKICTKDFTWKTSVPIENECTSDANCRGQNQKYFFEISTGKEFRYGCNLNTNKCEVKDERTPECNEAFKPCMGVGYSCREGICIPPPDVPVILPPGIEMKECSFFEELIDEKTYTCEGFLCHIGLAKPTIVEANKCVLKQSYTFLLIAIVLVIALYLILQPPRITPSIITGEKR